MVGFELHLPQRVIGLLGLGDELGGTHEGFQGDHVEPCGALVAEARDIAQVQHANHFVDVDAHHRHAGHTTAEKEAHRRTD